MQDFPNHIISKHFCWEFLFRVLASSASLEYGWVEMLSSSLIISEHLTGAFLA